MNQLDFAGRTAVVTGAAQGIGLAIARRLLASGARVRIWDRDGKLLA
ncbi:MAG: SDR family NAD(P)-dependent oxidoreductase, partial [Burkholderiales bacterium]